MKNRIIFFTRVPKAGTTKTRLYDFVSPDTAVEIKRVWGRNSSLS